MFPVIVSGSLTLTRLVPRRRSPVPYLFWFIHTFCGCPRRRSHVPSHRFWSGVTPAAPAQPRAEKEKTPRDEAASESPSGLSFPRPPGACALAHTREETGRAAPEREKEREGAARSPRQPKPCARESPRRQPVPCALSLLVHSHFFVIVSQVSLVLRCTPPAAPAQPRAREEKTPK